MRNRDFLWQLIFHKSFINHTHIFQRPEKTLHRLKPKEMLIFVLHGVTRLSYCKMYVFAATMKPSTTF